MYCNDENETAENMSIFGDFRHGVLGGVIGQEDLGNTTGDTQQGGCNEAGIG